jgi:hypothetical protein
LPLKTSSLLARRRCQKLPPLLILLSRVLALEALVQLPQKKAVVAAARVVTELPRYPCLPEHNTR